MLPFLKKHGEASASGPVDTVERKPDSDDPGYDMLDAIADDLMQALSTKNGALLKSALEALCDHIKDQDAQQDQPMEGDV